MPIVITHSLTIHNGANASGTKSGAKVGIAMTLHDGDTDPATPNAKTDPSFGDPTEPDARTDPGLGPGTTPPGEPPRSTRGAVRVPAVEVSSSAKKGGRNKDTIETLLDGMKNPQPVSPKVTPQTDGQASAAYSGAHQLHPGYLTPAPEPKVIVGNPSAASAASEQTMPPEGGIRITPVRSQMESTVITPRRQGRRVVIALVAAILTVFGVFASLKMWGNEQRIKAAQANPAASALIMGNPRAPVASAATLRAESQQSPAPAAAPAPVAPATAEAPNEAQPLTTQSNSESGSQKTHKSSVPQRPATKTGASAPASSAAPPLSGKIDRDYRLGE